MANALLAKTDPSVEELDLDKATAALDAIELPVVVIAVDSPATATAIVYANPAMSELIGCEAAHLAGTRLDSLLDGIVANSLADSASATARDGVPVQFDAEFRHTAGSAVRLSLKPLTTKAGHLVLCTAYPADARSGPISSALTNTPGFVDQLQEIVDTINEGFVLFDHEDRLVICNRRMHEIYPLRADVYRRGAKLPDIVRAGIDCGEISTHGMTSDEFIATRTARNRPINGVRENFLTDGRTILVSQRRTAEGGVVAIHTDITELRHAHELLRNAVEAMNEGFTLYGPDDRIIVCNETLRRLHPEMADILQPGVHFADVLRRQMEGGTWTAKPEDLDAYIQNRVQNRRLVEENVIERSRTDNTWIRVSGKLLPDGHYVAIHTDITEQKLRELALTDAKQEAEAASRAKSNFLANVSHELRTPLNAILGFSEVMREQMFGPIGSVRYLDYIADVHSSAHHLLELINDLLDMSKIEAGKLTLHDEFFALSPLVDECARHLAPLLEHEQVELHCDLAPGLPELRADLRSIRQILLNLLSNAVKFTPAGGRVDIAIRSDNGEFVFTVSDTGIGIRAEDLNRLTRPFQQVGNPMLSNVSGTGLGLSISRSLVEMHGGTIEIASEFGTGTTVTVRLPASRNASEPY